MLLSRGADYAIRAMVDLAGHPVEERMVTQAIAARQDIPLAFLSKVLGRLTQAGLVRAYRGAAGGVYLARPPEEISLLEVVEAVQGPLILSECTDPFRPCGMREACTVSPIWQGAKEGLEAQLGAALLSQLVK